MIHGTEVITRYTRRLALDLATTYLRSSQSQGSIATTLRKMSNTVQFINNLSSNELSQPTHSHSHDGEASHTHGPGEHGHTHEHLDHPGKRGTTSPAAEDLILVQGSSRSATCRTTLRATSKSAASPSVLEGVSVSRVPRRVRRSQSFCNSTKARGVWQDRAHACALQSASSGVQHRSEPCCPCCLLTPSNTTTATVTNDIFTREDQEFLIKNKALPESRILAIETGGCPHAAIREDISANMGALETLQAKYECQLLFVESGGDNLAANYSRELADYIIYVIDVSVHHYWWIRRRSLANVVLLPTGRGQDPAQGWSGYLAIGFAGHQ